MLLNKLNRSKKFNFSTITDPYYLLQVEKHTEFEIIKKQYFKLAQEFHPDRNKSKDATKQFIEIKKAFEEIKQQKGLTVNNKIKSINKKVRQESSQEKKPFESVRPNPEQYQERSEKMEDIDYKEYEFRTPNREEYADLKQSLNTISNMKDIKFRPDEFDLPNPSDRLQVEKRVKLSTFNDTGSLYAVIAFMCFGVIFYFTNQNTNIINQINQENTLQNLVNKQEYEQFYHENNETKNITIDLQKQIKFQEFQKNIVNLTTISNYALDIQVPQPKKFTIKDY